MVVLEVYGIAAAVNHVGFNWSAYFRALARTRPIAIVNVAATLTFLVAGIPLLLELGLRGFAIGVAAQAMVAVALRAYYLQRIFPGFDFLRHAARAFLPTVPAVVVVLVLRALASGGQTLGMALAELATYLAVTVVATWYFESGLIREAIGALLDRPAAAAAS